MCALRLREAYGEARCEHVPMNTLLLERLWNFRGRSYFRLDSPTKRLRRGFGDLP